MRATLREFSVASIYISRVLLLMLDVAPTIQTAAPCKRRNRVFDSGSQYPVRISFAWAGGPLDCDDIKGIGALINETENAIFRERLKNDADFIVANVGSYEVAGRMPVESYLRAIPKPRHIKINAQVPIVRYDRI
jgi:hypothetical protein